MSGVLDEVAEGFELSPELVSVMAESKSAVLLGLDIGTSGVRATLFDDRGHEVPRASVRTTRRSFGSAHLTELEADAGVELVADTVDLLLSQALISTDQIELISISCFWHSLVGIDADGRASTPVLGWAETRATDAARQLRDTLNETEVHARTGCRFHPSYWPAKLLWLRREQPETFARTHRWLSFSEYLTNKLFRDTSISVSMASGTGLLNQRTCEWDTSLLKLLDLRIESLSRISQHTVTRTRLTEEYAARWPQLRGALLCPAIADGAANNIGAGCTTREKIAVMIGTSAAVRVLYKGEPPDSIPFELWCYRADRARVVVGGALSDGGGLYRWLQESLLPDESDETIEEALSRLKPDSHGLTVLPFWAGERSTGWSLSATGGVFGLTHKTKPIEILLAAMEAVAYRLAMIVEALNPIIPEASIVVSGNALQSSTVWSQIVADVLGRPISVSNIREASSRGAALLALEAAGKIPFIEIESNAVEQRFTPDASRNERYQKGIERQRRLYKALN